MLSAKQADFFAVVAANGFFGGVALAVLAKLDHNPAMQFGADVLVFASAAAMAGIALLSRKK